MGPLSYFSNSGSEIWEFWMGQDTILMWFLFRTLSRISVLESALDVRLSILFPRKREEQAGGDQRYMILYFYATT